MSDNPEKIAELQNDKLVETLLSKKLGVPVCRHIESKGHNGQQFVKPEYVIETFPSVEYLRSIKLLKAQIRSLVSVRKELHVETSTVPYLEINSNANAAAASSSSSKTTTLTAEESEKLLQEAAPLLTNKKYSEATDLYSKVVDAISITETDSTFKQILSRALSNRSGSFLGLKKAKEALVDARRCVDIRPSWVRGHLRVAAAAEELEEFDVAVSAYQAAMKSEDRTGNVPSQKDLEAEILRVKQKNWREVISETTDEFDEVFNPETKTVDFETIERFCEYLQVFIVNKYSSSTRHKIAAREGLVWISKFITDSSCATSFFASISIATSNSTRNSGENQMLFRTEAVRDALLLVSKYCTDADSAEYFCYSMSNLASNSADNRTEYRTVFNFASSKNNQAVFGTENIRDALLLVSKYCTTAKAAYWFCSSVCNLTCGTRNQQLFGTAAFRDAFLLVAKYCTTPDAALFFCGSLSNLVDYHSDSTNDNNRILLGTEAVREALLVVSKYCTTSDAAHWFCCCISHLTCKNCVENQKLLGTATVRDALLRASKYCADHFAAQYFCGAIRNLVSDNNGNQILFGTAVIRDALLRVSKYCTTRDSVRFFCGTIHNFASNNGNKKLFETEAVRVALTAVSQRFPEAREVLYELFPQVMFQDLRKNK